MIQKGVLTPIPNHFTESNYLDSLPIETRLKGQKKIGFTPKKNRSKFFEGFWVVLSKIHGAPVWSIFREDSVKKKKPGYERRFARNKYLKSKLESDRTVTRGGSP